MANPEHLAKLEEGVEAWNAWRKKYPGIVPDLQGADLGAAQLQRARLSAAKLQGANLTEASLQGADLRAAKLQGATLWEVNLEGADLRMAQLQGARLWRAKLKDADLGAAQLQGAELLEANFEGADVRSIEFNRRGRYRGIRVATCYGSPRFKRFAQDQDFLEELRSDWMGRMIYWVWLIFADCGRSFLLWLCWCVAMAVGYGLGFYSMGEAAFELKSKLPWGLGSMIYYSVVTFTTLGFGDVIPNTLKAARWVMAEVITGYVMLGGLITIFATKLARRS